MKVWILTLGNTGDLYSIDYMGGYPCFESQELAEERATELSKLDTDYLRPRGGLLVKSVEAEPQTLMALKLFVADTVYKK